MKNFTIKIFNFLSIFYIGSFYSCSNDNSIPSSSSTATGIEYNINGLIQEFDSATRLSIIYDRANFCNNDGYVYLINSMDGNININMIGSISHENKNIIIENINNVKSFNDLEIEDSCKIGGYQDGLFVNVNQTKYYYKSGIFETQFKEIVNSDFVEHSQRDIVIFKDTIFMNDQNEEIIINAEHEIVTEFIK